MTLSPPMQRLAVFAGAAALLFALGFCTGTSHAPNPAIAQLDAHRDTVRDTIRVVEARIHVDTVRVAATVATAKLERRAVDSTERVVLAVADTSSTVPSSLVIPALDVCDQALAADSAVYLALQATLADMTTARNAERDRADTDERETKLLKPPRFGFLSGLLSGAGAVVGVIWLARR
jgi:hypothetical protein